MAAADEPWGQLVSTTEVQSEPVMMKKLKFSIGRSPACDLSFNGNKLVSGTHCILERDTKGKTWIEDKSTNGTLLNLNCKISKKRIEIEHGDEIHIVYRKNNPETNIAFVFQDILMLQMETSDSTIEYVPSENDVPTSEYGDEGSGGEALRVQDEAPDISPPPPRAKAEVPNTVLGGKRKRTISSTLEQLPNKKCSIEKTDPTPGGAGNAQPDTPSKMADHAAEGKNPPTDEADSVKNAAMGAPQDALVKPAQDDDTMDDIQESLTCIICQEIFHNCIGLQPCMHSFCAGCYSDWMPQSDECPSCRGKVTRISKNHLINNLVEAYLKSHPDKVRPQEDITEQDAKNKITMDMLYPKDQLRRASDSDFSDDSHSESDNDSGSTDVDYHPPIVDDPFRRVVALPSRAVAGFQGGFRVPPMLKTVCRQCPEYSGPYPTGRAGESKPKGAGLFIGIAQNEATTTAPPTTTGAGPIPGPSGTEPGGTAVAGASLPDVKTMPSIPPYTCTPDQTHALCRCCLQPMPQRDHTNGNLPPISCVICYRNFCHAYWGCYQKCNGCLGRFKDMNFGKDCLHHMVMDNVYESAILENYMKLKKMTVRDLLAVCMRRLQGGAYTTQDHLTGLQLTPETPLCRDCGLRNLKDLAYQYRRDIPSDELPPGVTSRPDCHWGKNCRTQRNNPRHAARFNHICEQTMAS